MTATAQPTTLPDGSSLLREYSGWDDPRALAPRAAMDAEIGPRYAALRGSAPLPAQPTTEDVAVVMLGLARRVLSQLEEAARARGAEDLFFQTGDRQPEAIAFYEREGWARIDVFAPYDPADGISVCFRKALTPRP